MIQEQQSDLSIYANDIWSAFCAKLGRERIMAPIEWQLVKYWDEQAVPLRLILGAMDDHRGNPPKTLLYFEPAVAERVRKIASGM